MNEKMCYDIGEESVMRMNSNKKCAIFMGTPEFAREILKSIVNYVDVTLVVSQPDAIVGRKKLLTKSPVKEYAESIGIEVFTPTNIKTDYKKIIDSKPDIIITCAYGQLVPKAVLDYPEYGSINVHASLLPKLRGGAPIHHAIIDGEKETGITIMYMDENLDSGDIISYEKTEITDSDTLETLSNKLIDIGCKLLVETLPKIFDKTNERIKQDSNQATYAPIITKETEHIDFSKSTKDVYNLIRGLNPSPGAFTILNGEVVKVYEALKKDNKGKISCINNIYKDGIGIGTSDGEIVLTKIKPAGKNAISVKDYLNGHKDNLLGSMLE